MKSKIKERIVEFAHALIDQDKANVIIEPNSNSKGFWFGGGNMVFHNGVYYLCGRYRDEGDSRTGVGAGERGLELAIFSSDCVHGPWVKVKSFLKSDLKYNDESIVSIEGSSLLVSDHGIDLFVSTEKDRSYPNRVVEFQKKGTGIWDIDQISAPSVEQLDTKNIKNTLRTEELGALHVKDPVAFNINNSIKGTGLFFCSHPFTWASSNTGLAIKESGETEFKIKTFCAIDRGHSWDVACSRITDRLQIPKVGILADSPSAFVYFYDGAECLRSLDENPAAAKRPRGYSCEEIGGIGFACEEDFPEIISFSEDFPAFISPHGTGCSRYVSTLQTNEGILATWQQSQKDESQPLVANFLSNDEILEIFSS